MSTPTPPASKSAFVAAPRGFCAGVVRAIETVEEALRLLGPPVYVRKEIVHNPFVVQELRRKGAVFVNELDEVPKDALVIFSAHGVSPEVRQQARERRLRVIDATCPLVTKVHVEAVRYAREGYSILLVGHASHDEVAGTLGEAPRLIRLVQTREDAERVQVRDPQRVAVITQTTLSVDDTQEIIEALRRRFPTLVTPSRADICFATQNRQDAVKLMAKKVDVILVLGAQNSSNSQRLREVAESSGARAYLVTSPDELDPAWLRDISSVGVTAGASTPEFLVERTVTWLRENGVQRVEELATRKEEVQFALPRELPQVVA
ncbi:MAG: 4-hydroxy-3-methylbut-2-enyl diphosphate reductase [Chloroflexi bacterium]|nr:4-hydroxy-3-methylbut-2-enyl diphosphate reductase [Chloroflexota bacterium]